MSQGVVYILANSSNFLSGSVENSKPMGFYNVLAQRFFSFHTYPYHLGDWVRPYTSFNPCIFKGTGATNSRKWDNTMDDQ